MSTKKEGFLVKFSLELSEVQECSKLANFCKVQEISYPMDTKSRKVPRTQNEVTVKSYFISLIDYHPVVLLLRTVMYFIVHQNVYILI